MAKTGELALGILFVLISLPFLIYYATVSSIPFAGGIFAESLRGVAGITAILLIAGIVLLADSQSGSEGPKVTTPSTSARPKNFFRPMSALEERILVMLADHKTQKKSVRQLVCPSA